MEGGSVVMVEGDGLVEGSGVVVVDVGGVVEGVGVVEGSGVVRDVLTDGRAPRLRASLGPSTSPNSPANFTRFFRTILHME